MMAAKPSRLFRVSTCLSLLLAVFAVHTPRSSPATDPDVVQYLTEVFDRVKGSGRKPVNEELNLLPNENEGFANMVRCFSADHIDYRPDDQIRTSRTQLLRTNKIELSFHLYGLENTDRIVSVRVVFKHRPSMPHFRVTAYEMKENGFMMRLDSQVSDGGWVDLNVQDIFELHKEEKTRSKSTDYRPPLDREHHVVLELTELNSARASEKLISILPTLNPFIAVYTYDNEVYEHLSGGAAGRQQHQQESSHMGRTMSKRQATVTSEGGSQSTDPFAHLRRSECQLHGVNITVQELGWVSPAYEVILPYWLNFTFCHGRCDLPVGTRNRDKYSAHAKTLKLLKPDLARTGVAPSCAPSRNPADMTSVQIILLSGNVTETTTIPLVQSCICQ